MRTSAGLGPVFLAASMAGAALGFGTAVSAQTTTPGEILRPLTPQPDLAPAEATPQMQTGSAARTAAGSGMKVTINRFEFSGHTLFGTAELRNLLVDYLNRPVTLVEIYEAADRVAARYHAEGHLLASVNVPPQKITGGTISMLISEGRIGALRAEGNASYSEKHLARYLKGADAGRVYQDDTLKSGLRQLNALPGLQARAVIKPGEVEGTSDVVIRVAEDRFEGALTVDNYGRESIGEFRYSAFGQLNNPLRLGDQLQILALLSEDELLKYGYAAYSLPLGYYGTRLTVSYGAAEFEILDTPVDGTSRSGRAVLEHPYVKTAQDSFTGSFGVSRTLSDADFGGATFNDTSITLLELGAVYTHTYRNLAVTQVSTGIATNFNRLSRAELNAPNGDGSDQRMRWELDLQHLQPLPASLQLFTRLNGVYSPDPLTPSQQYALGGPTTIRGYAPAEIRGDRGYFGSAALRRPISIGGARLLGRIFIDAGKVFSVDAPGVANESRSSAGLGFDARLSVFELTLDWAFPLDDKPTSDGRDDSRVYGAFSVKF